MAGTGRLAARRKARLLPTGRVAHGLAQRSRAVHPLPPPRLETEQRSSPPPLPPPCAVRLTRRHSAPRHCSTWGPTAASAAAAAAGPTAAAPFQIRLGRDPRRRVAGLEPPITIPGDRDPRLRHLLAGTHTYGAGTHSCHSTLSVCAVRVLAAAQAVWLGELLRPVRGEPAWRETEPPSRREGRLGSVLYCS